MAKGPLGSFGEVSIRQGQYPHPPLIRHIRAASNRPSLILLTRGCFRRPRVGPNGSATEQDSIETRQQGKGEKDQDEGRGDRLRVRGIRESRVLCRLLAVVVSFTRGVMKG